MSYKISTADVEVVLVEAPGRVPRKLVKGQPTPSAKPFSVLDRESLVEIKSKEPSGLSVTAWDTVENRRTLEIWRRVQALKEKKIEKGSREDDEYSRLEFELGRTALGRSLQCALSLEWEETPEKKAERMLEEQEVEKEWEVIEKYLGYDEEKHRLVWHPQLHRLLSGEIIPETKVDINYHCPKCNVIFSGEELEYVVCPKCEGFLQEIMTAHLWEINAEHIGKRIMCRAVIVGEGPAKAVYPEWTAECRKCGLKIEINLPSPELKQTFFELLVAKGSFGSSDVMNVLSHTSDLPKCVHGEHAWNLKPEEPALNYREVYLRDDAGFEEAMDRSIISKNYPVVLIGESPETQKIDVSGTIILNPKNNVLNLIVDSFEEASPTKPAVLTEEDKQLLKTYFKNRSLDEWLKFSEENICLSIVGRPEPKLASLLIVNTPLWVSLDGVSPIPATLRTMFIGDKRCGKGMIINWWRDGVGVGEHGVGESASRAGLSYFVEVETGTIIWGLLPQADRGLALIEALHGLPSEQMMEFREILASQRVEVRKKVSGCRWARTRIIADANPPKAMSQYVYPAFAIPSLRCFHDPVDITRWDLYVPFFSYDVSEEEIAKAKPTPSDPKFIEALRKLVSWVWNLKVGQVKVEEATTQRLEDATIRLIQAYRLEELPLIHNASKWTVLRLACALATITLSTDNFETLTVKPEHVDLAEAFLQHLLRLWKLEECKVYLKAQPLTEEKWLEIQSYLEKKEVATEILETLAFKPLDGLALAGKIGHDYGYVRKILAELRQIGLADRGAQGYTLTPMGTETCRRLKSIKTEKEGGKMEEDTGTHCWACRKLVIKGYVVAKDGRPYCMKCYKEIFSQGE